jgi:hypothetical protein
MPCTARLEQGRTGLRDGAKFGRYGLGVATMISRNCIPFGCERFFTADSQKVWVEYVADLFQLRERICFRWVYLDRRVFIPT